ncbi:MAG TPA: NAD(P)-dependent oxidoreductase [bacterium]|nr:NAD(P)-dependent oxidoreductase [bacterium]HPJ71234.1 NAD(P)-dependent oxidoreductase [bacterium]HPQ65473.1 NAD(P)-dependent oxidoreductase [bacterium]
MAKKVLIATSKPFAPEARDAALAILAEGGCEAEALESYNDPSQLTAALAGVNGLIVRSDQITAEVLKAGKDLEIVVRAGAGYDNIDCETARELGIVVENTPGQNANAVAELALGMMIMIARGNYSGKSGTELRGKVLGLQGFGNVARRVAEIASRGFEMKIVAFDPYLPEETFRAAGAEKARSLEELYRRCDYLSLHVPSLPETKGSVDYGLLSLMKDGAVLVNTARADIVDENDLLRIYRERPGFRYISDVAPGNREEIVSCDGNRCFFTPKKMGAQSAEANFNAGTAAAAQIVAFFKTGDTAFKVN